MTIQVQCQCGARLSVSDQFAGKRGKCPKCGSAVAIPAAATSAPADSPSSFPAAGTPASPSLQPQLHNPLHGAAPLPGQPQPFAGQPLPPSDPAGAAWGNATPWPGMQSPQGMMGAPGMPAYGGFGPQGGSGFGQPQFAAPNYSQQKARPRKKRVDSDMAKRIGKITGGIVGFAVAFVVSFLVRNAFQADLGNLSWQTHHSAQGRFRVDMPGTPQAKSQAIPAADVAMSLQMEGVELKRGTAFIVMYCDMPSELRFDVEDCLDGGVAGLSAQHPTHSVSRVECDGHPGREVYYTADTGRLTMYGRAQFFVVGRRLYQVHYVGKEGTEQHPDVERFLSSFHPE